uniref:Uncharacterized protein n=1 Tax=Anguilla anguilla TaxID=7936 RepID=A0A0E9X6B2_ANGAN
MKVPQYYAPELFAKLPHVIVCYEPTAKVHYRAHNHFWIRLHVHFNYLISPIIYLMFLMKP